MRSLFAVVAALLVGYALGNTGGGPFAAARSIERPIPRAPDARVADVPPQRDKAPVRVDPEDAWLQSCVSAPGPEPVTGEGTIRGIVLDEDGQPVEGVVISAVPQGFGNVAPAGASPVQRYVARRAWEDASRRTAVTDRDGRYEVRGLGEALYTLNPELSGYDFNGWMSNVHAGAVSDFKASRVVRIRVTVLMPDGRVAPFARVELLADGRLSGVWSPANDTRELKPGAWIARATHPTKRLLASERVRVDLRWGEPAPPVVLRLAERPAIRGTVRLANGARPDSAMIYLQPYRDRVDPGFALDDRAETALEDREAGTFGFYDLEPGAYWISAAVPGGDVDSRTLVDIRDGVTEVDLVVSCVGAGPLAVLDDVTDHRGAR